MVAMSSRLLLNRLPLKLELAIGFPAESNAVVFLSSAWAIRSELSHQNCPRPPSTCTLPKCIVGLICPPNIQPSSLLANSAKVHWRPWSFT